MSASEIDWYWQSLRLDNELNGLDGDRFEERFQTIAKAAWGADFSGTTPMGRRGDLKCDGFRRSTGSVFQCYGPRYGKVEVDDALAKIDTDFRGALAGWEASLLQWTFVMNVYRDKVPSEIVRLIEKLAKELAVPAEPWGRAEIVTLAQTIPADVRAILLGRAPQQADMVRITYNRIGRALAAIKGALGVESLAHLPLPPDMATKAEWNLLSPSAQNHLLMGQIGADRVRQFLLNQVDPEEAERMAAGFTARYVECRNEGKLPEAIFTQMIHYAGGGTGDPEGDVASLAIVSHFFSTCEIFEAPPIKAAS